MPGLRGERGERVSRGALGRATGAAAGRASRARRAALVAGGALGTLGALVDFCVDERTSRVRGWPGTTIQSDNLSDAIKFFADLRSIKIGNKEITYLINHSRRSMSELVAHINQLDKLSMQLKRKITIPLIKEVIES